MFVNQHSKANSKQHLKMAFRVLFTPSTNAIYSPNVSVFHIEVKKLSPLP